MKDRLAHWLQDLLSTRHTDPEQVRRGRLLGILILGLMGATALSVLVQLQGVIANGPTTGTTNSLGVGLLGLLGLGTLLHLNRIGYTRPASYILLLSLTVAASMMEIESEDQVILLHVIPTAAASFLIQPVASFLFAALSGLGHTIALASSRPESRFDYVSMIGLFLIALMAWLIATNLEAALSQVRLRADELDRRVMSRTRDLVEALERERVGAGKLQAILQSISDGVIVFDHSGRAIVVNPAACAILEHREGNLLGKKVRRIIDGTLSDEDQRVIGSLVESKQPTSNSLKITWGRKTIALNFAPVRLPSAEQASVVMVLRDITKEAEIDQLKSEFVSIVSHELRTPMTAIKGYLDLLALGSAGTVTEMQRHYLSIIKTNADRLSDMVNELLDLSSIESGKAQMNFQAISVRRVIYEVVAMLQKSFNDRGIRLRVNIQDGLPDALADPGRLTQIITNLLSNAAKYTFEGYVEVSARVEGDTIQVDVTDTGIGMTEQDQAKLFARFFRASTARAREIPGTGLGLSITRSLVEMHGGRIWIKSAVGEGSTFSFTIPKLPEPLAHMASPAPEEPWTTEPHPVPETARILIVDNELHIAQLFRYQLEKDNYTVLLTTRPTEVLPSARRERPDLILLDVMMPGLDGFEVLRQLKQDPDTMSIPVIIMSVLADEEKGFALGAADYLTKPLDNRLLQTTVRRVLAQRHSEKPWSVLVVDDEADCRHWLLEALAKQGLRTTEARDGQEALDIIAAHPPHLIVLDLEMPVMDGWAVIRALKETPQTARIPIIVLTGNSIDSAQNKTRLLEMGVQHFLIKPILVEMLVRQVREQLAA
jgi:PAS domain S-box-containing protein